MGSLFLQQDFDLLAAYVVCQLPVLAHHVVVGGPKCCCRMIDPVAANARWRGGFSREVGLALAALRAWARQGPIENFDGRVPKPGPRTAEEKSCETVRLMYATRIDETDHRAVILC